MPLIQRHATLTNLWPEKELVNITHTNGDEQGLRRFYDPLSQSAIREAFVDTREAVRLAGPNRLRATRRPARVAHSYTNDLYHRLHFMSYPNTGKPVSLTNAKDIDAGLITTDTTWTFLFWNAHLDHATTINKVEINGEEGLTVGFPTPHTLNINRETTAAVTVNIEGPSMQDSTVTFKNNEHDKKIKVTANRLTAFHPEPAWGEGFTMKMHYDTVISKLGRQYEQRRALSDYPMWEFSFKMWDTGQAGRDYMSLFEGNFDKVYSLPLYTAGARVKGLENDNGVIKRNGVEVKDLATNWWITRLARMVMLNDHITGQKQILTVVEILPERNIVRFAETIKLTNITAAYPCLQAYVDNAQGKIITDDLTVWDVTFKGYVRGPETLRGLPALPAEFAFPLEYGQTIKQTPEMTRAIAYNKGGVEIIAPVIPYGLDRFKASVTLLGPADEFRFLDFFAAARGRHLSFTLKNPAILFKINRDYAAGVNMAIIDESSYNYFDKRPNQRYWFKNPGEDYIGIKLAGMEKRPDGKSNLHFVNEMPVAIKKGATIGRIYDRVRFDKDALSIKYLAAGKAVVDLTFKEVNR